MKAAASIVIALVLLLGYLGGYFYLLQPAVMLSSSPGGPIMGAPPALRGGKWVQRAYGPVVWVDQKVRPEFWHPSPSFDELIRQVMSTVETAEDSPQDRQRK